MFSSCICTSAFVLELMALRQAEDTRATRAPLSAPGVSFPAPRHGALRFIDLYRGHLPRRLHGRDTLQTPFWVNKGQMSDHEQE